MDPGHLWGCFIHLSTRWSAGPYQQCHPKLEQKQFLLILGEEEMATFFSRFNSYGFFHVECSGGEGMPKAP